MESLFGAFLLCAVGFMRGRYKGRDLSWKQRALRGASLGAVFSVPALFYIVDYRQASAQAPASTTDLFLIVIGFAAMGALMMQDIPDSNDQDIRELLDDPDNVSPGERVQRARQELANRDE